MYNIEKKLFTEATPIENVIVNRAYKRHKAVCENWTYGDPFYFWYDSNNVLCIEYKNGDESIWFHYNTQGEWW